MAELSEFLEKWLKSVRFYIPRWRACLWQTATIITLYGNILYIQMKCHSPLRTVIFTQNENDSKGNFHYLQKMQKCKIAFEGKSVLMHFRTSIL